MIKKTSCYKSIPASKKSFNKLLKKKDYQAIISDDVQRLKLIEFLMIQPNGHYLDLACGTGYVGFEIAKKFPGSSVIGIDIADRGIRDNVKKAKVETLTNIGFRSFDGIKFPVFKRSFDGIICRYALHHFPCIETTLDSIKKIVESGGRVVIADAVKNEHDQDDFINKFQRLNKDGHVRMYTRNEMVNIFKENDFIEAESFDSTITFSRNISPKYNLLLESTPPETKKKYSVAADDRSVTLTFSILNIAFEYKPNESLQPTC